MCRWCRAVDHLVDRYLGNPSRSTSLPNQEDQGLADGPLPRGGLRYREVALHLVAVPTACPLLVGKDQRSIM